MSRQIKIDNKTYSLPDKKPELLMPAGDLEKAKYAFAFGADAIYAGVPVFALRTKENKFTIDEIKQIVDYAHSLNKKVYITTNIYPHNEKIKPFLEALDQIVEIKPDALIVSDPGVLFLIQEKYPDLELHLSVQQNNVNWASAKFWGQNGIKRIILARELSLKEMKEITQKNPELEFEAFVHGAMCMAYSGRCLLSSYFSNRDANQGTCAQSCRWQYKVLKEKDDNPLEITGRQSLRNDNNQETNISNYPLGTYFLEEKLRPGELIPIEEDENGTYLFNSRDLCMIDYIEDLMDAGICSFKVEGRNKSLYYAAVVARAYREAIDSIYDKGEKPDVKKLLDELFSAGNRGFIPGFFAGHPDEHGQRYDGNTMMQTHTFAGKMISKNGTEISFEAKNKIDVGDTIEILTPTKTITHTISEMTDSNGQKIQTINPGSGIFTIKLDEDIDGDFCVARWEGQQKTTK